MKRKHVARSMSYRADLDAIEAYVAQDNPRAAAELWLLIDEQVDQLLARRAVQRPPPTQEHVFLTVDAQRAHGLIGGEPPEREAWWHVPTQRNMRI